MIRSMTLEELREIYHKHMMHDFPDDERKPLFVIEKRYQKKQNLCLCYVEEDYIKGYSILEFSKKNKCLLMDYFAVVSEYRNQGAGTRFMNELKEYFKEWNAVLIESESIFDQTSKKRLEFYQRCGAVISSIKVNLYFVDYEILVISLKKDMNQADVKKDLDEIYGKIYPKPFQKLYLKWKN